MTTNKAQNLISAIRKANQASINASRNNDGGTCNLDSLCIDLNDFTDKQIKEVMQSDYVSLEKWAGKVYFVHFTLFGQADNRTRMIKAANESLKKDGYKSFIQYQLD